MDHALHAVIGDLLRVLEKDNITVLLDSACGGSRCINFYSSNAIKLAQVDAAIAVNDEIRVVIEIEETDLRPLAMGGKVLMPAISKTCKYGGNIYSISEQLLFIQIFIKKNPSEEWSKRKQCWYLQEEIPKSLKQIAQYSFHLGTADEYQNDPAHGEELLKEIQDFLASIRARYYQINSN